MLKYFSASLKISLNPIKTITLAIAISWLYAIASQCSIHLPFLLSPISLQPAPIFLFSFLFGWPAFYGYVLYLIQGYAGAPFFAGGKGGIMHLFGPTTGYLFGFLLASLFIVKMRKNQESAVSLLTKIYIGNLLVFGCGLAHLALLVPTSILLAQGFYPFFLGDFMLKPLTILLGYTFFSTLIFVPCEKL